MSNNKKLLSTYPLYFIEVMGKPFFWLFTLLGIIFFLFIHFINKIKTLIFYKLTHFHVPKYPKLKFTPPQQLSFKLHLPKFTPNFKHYLTIIITILTLSTIFYYLFLKDLPNPHTLSTSLPALSTKIYDRNGELLYQIYRDENRTLIHLQNLPKDLINATISAEDKSFYHHFGINPIAIFRAILHNAKCYLQPKTCTTSIQGASTITQQLVKNALLSPERTLTRKIKEAILAIWLETIYTKDEILEMYFNYVPYGGTAYGIEAGSQYYFGKSATQLNLAESTFLAGLPISPTTLSPFGVNPHLAKHRQIEVVKQMVKQHYLTQEQADQALSTPLTFASPKQTILAPHFVMYIQNQLVQQFGEDMVYHGGLQVITTLDLKLQQTLENNIKQELNKLTHLHVQNGAGIIIDPHTGEILAMVGSKDFFNPDQDGQVNLTLNHRPPGSSIKPLTYALAFNQGFTPATRIDDSPICFTSPKQKPYCPRNYDGKFHGSVTLRTALASSYNIPALKLLNQIGVDKLIKFGQQLGITTWNHPENYGLALTLGGGDVTLLELTNIYATFARGGSYLPTKSIISITDHTMISPTPPPTPKQIISPSVAYQISSILSDNYARSPAFGYHSVLYIPNHQVAVKTGTSNDLRDNWTIGYTSDYAVGIWVGNNDNSPMSSVASGITGASPIWHNTIQALLKDKPAHTFKIPANLVKVNLSCTQRPYYEYFIPGTEIKPNCKPKNNDNNQLLPDSTSI